MQHILLVIHTLVALLLIVLVLVQQGKGAEAGASFGAGASGSMFGSKGATPFLVKVTTVLAVMFFATSLSLTYLGSRSSQQPLLKVPAAEKEKTDKTHDIPMTQAKLGAESKSVKVAAKQGTNKKTHHARLRQDPKKTGHKGKG